MEKKKTTLEGIPICKTWVWLKIEPKATFGTMEPQSNELKLVKLTC